MFEDNISAVTYFEKRWVVCVALVLVIIFFLPYGYGWINTPPEKEYMIGSGDLSTYFAYMSQAMEGRILLEDFFTTDTQIPRMLNPFFLLSGWLAKLFFLPLKVFWIILRSVLIIIFSLVSYRLISDFFEEERMRKIAFIFFLLASGLGFYITISCASCVNNSESVFVDYMIPQAFTFSTLLWNALHIASTIFIFLTFHYFYRSSVFLSRRDAIKAGICALILISFHPYHIPTILTIPAVYILISVCFSPKQWFERLCLGYIYFILTLPSVLYQLFMIRYDWVTMARFSEIGEPMPPPFWILLSYLPFVVGVLFCLVQIIRKRLLRPRFFFLLAWFIVGFALIIFPSFVQHRRLTQGLSFPLSMLTLAGLYVFGVFSTVLHKHQTSFRGWYHWFLTGYVFLFVFFPSTLSNYFSYIHLVSISTDDRIYLPKEKTQAIVWMKENTLYAAGVLTNFLDSNFLAGLGLKKVYSGHLYETNRFFEKEEKKRQFFSNSFSSEEERAFLQENHIDYIFFTKRESELGFDPEKREYLREVYQNPLVRIYSVEA